MAFTGYQVSLTTGAQKLSTLIGVTPGDLIYGFDVILKSGETAIGYGGNSALTNVPANAGFTFTASIGYSSPVFPFQIVSTDKVYLTASGACTAHVNIWE